MFGRDKLSKLAILARFDNNRLSVYVQFEQLKKQGLNYFMCKKSPSFLKGFFLFFVHLGKVFVKQRNGFNAFEVVKHTVMFVRWMQCIAI